MNNHGFGWALDKLQEGERLRRDGWINKGMWIELQRPDAHSKMTLPYLFISLPSKDLVPWAPSQYDILATDWNEVHT